MAATQGIRPSFGQALIGLGAVLCAASSLSCDIVKPKDRFINDAAGRPTSEAVDPTVLAPGQHVAGVVTVQLNSTSGLPIAYVSLAVDDSIMATSYNPPFPLSLNTRSAPQGVHDVLLLAYESNPNMGLYGLAGLPSLVQGVSVVFDSTLPTPVALTSVTWDNGAPLVQWTLNADPNFFSYEVFRDGLYRPPALAPILARTTLSKRDPDVPQIHGMKVDYRVNVSNRERTAVSNVVTLRYGDRVPGLDFLTLGRPITSPVADEFYAFYKEPNYDTLMAVSTLTHARTRTANLSFPGAAALTRDGASLLVLRYNVAQLSTYEASTFAPQGSVSVPGPIASGPGMMMEAGRPGRAYTGSYSGLYILNTATGAQVAQVPLAVSNPRIALSPNTNTLYAAMADSVYRIDVTTDVPSVLVRRRTAQPIADIQISSDGQRIYLGHQYGPPSNYVEILDPSSLATVGQVAVAAGEQLFDFLATPSYLYVSESRQDPHDPFFLAGRVIQYSRSNLSPLRSWDFLQVPSKLVTSRDEQWLYAMGSETWIIAATAPAPFLARW